MLGCFAQQTGMEVQEGCDLSARLYAVAAQIFSLYVQADWVGRQCFPQTAQGEYLDHHAFLRGLERKKATKAQGMLRFLIDIPGETDREIPAGTVCMTADLVRFETTENGVLSAGETQIDIPAQAVEAGKSGNVAANTVVSMAVAPVGVSACGNAEAFSGGGDAEEDEMLRGRVLATYKRLPNGANAAFYEQEALGFDEVTAVKVLPRARGQGTVDVVVATAGGVPEQQLLQQLQDYFQTRREIAVDVQVRAPETVDVALQVQVTAKQGQDSQSVLQRVTQALGDWFTGQRLGEDVLLAKLGSVIYSCQGVENYRILSPEADVAVAEDQLPVLAGLSVEELA